MGKLVGDYTFWFQNQAFLIGCSNTLNRAISKMFGREVRQSKHSKNLMGDMEYFTVHDLLRTCRTLLAKLGVSSHVAERCLNHKLKGVKAVYNQHDYFEERAVALTKLAKQISYAL